MKTTARMHKHPLKSAGFKVLKAPDVPSVLVELGYVSNKADLQQLVSEDWRGRAGGAAAQGGGSLLCQTGGLSQSFELTRFGSFESPSFDTAAALLKSQLC